MEDFKFQRVLSPLNAWSFSFACLLGWGAFVMPATVFLPGGGVAGSLLAYLIGGVAVALIAMNYHYLAQQCKGSGGIYYLLHNTLGREHAYAASWAICFAHMCIIPLNARAFARLVRALLSEYLHIEYRIPFLNSSMMLMDFLVILLVLILFARINTHSMRLTARLQTGFAIVLLAGIVLLFILSLTSGVDIKDKMTPSYYPGKGKISSFLYVFIMIPWAFVGFDSVPALARETKFSKKKLGRIMVLAVAAGTFGYMANIVITLLGVPDAAGSWPNYVDQAASMQGLDGIAVVGAARRLLGTPGLVIALITLLAAILSGPNGTIAMVSRLVFVMSRSNALFPRLGKTNDKGVPHHAINFAVFTAIIMLLVASTFNVMEAIASICTAFGYGYCSLSAFLTASRKKQLGYMITGGAGTLVCLIWMVLLMVPGTLTQTEAGLKVYTCLAMWVFVGIWGYALTCRKPDEILDD